MFKPVSYMSQQHTHVRPGAIEQAVSTLKQTCRSAVRVGTLRTECLTGRVRGQPCGTSLPASHADHIARGAAHYYVHVITVYKQTIIQPLAVTGICVGVVASGAIE
jgi:hypothetical protein